MKKIAQVLIVTILFFQCAPKESHTGNNSEPLSERPSEDSLVQDFLRYIDVPFAKGLIKGYKNLIIIDVRTPEENAEGGIDNSIVVDVESDDFDERIAEFALDSTYLIYCRSGKRSTRAVNIMSEMGFKRIYMLNGGFLAWEEE